MEYNWKKQTRFRSAYINLGIIGIFLTVFHKYNLINPDVCENIRGCNSLRNIRGSNSLGTIRGSNSLGNIRGFRKKQMELFPFIDEDRKKHNGEISPYYD